MSRLFLFAGIIIAITGLTWAFKVSAQQKQNPNKLYEVKLTLTDWSTKIQYLEYIKNQLRQSDLPSKQVAFMSDSLITPFETSISTQINQQLAEEQRKDTVKPKK